jgi:hypothetical protein
MNSIGVAQTLGADPATDLCLGAKAAESEVYASVGLSRLAYAMLLQLRPNFADDFNSAVLNSDVAEVVDTLERHDGIVQDNLRVFGTEQIDSNKPVQQRAEDGSARIT